MSEGLRTATIRRFVVASSPEMASRNRNGALHSFADEPGAWREMATKPNVYPADAGFAVFCVDISVSECDRPTHE